MKSRLQTNKAFTLIELVVAVALLALILSFSGVIFKVGINSYRIAAVNSEIMQKLRVITEQLDADFRGLPQDGFLVLYSEIKTRNEYSYSPAPYNFRADRIYYYTTDDFSSWFPPYTRSNIARIYFGHDRISLTNANVPVNKWVLARDVALLTPGAATPLPLDCNDISYAQRKADIRGTLADANNLLLIRGVSTDMQADPNNIRRLMCQNIGGVIIEWTDGTKYPPPDNSLAWFSLSMARKTGNPSSGIPAKPEYGSIEEIDATVPPAYYWARWTPLTPKVYWPKAIKFTFTLYDSKNVLRAGQTFTHIVYLED